MEMGRYLGAVGISFSEGVLRGRSMIANIVDIERTAQLRALSSEDPALLLFDFSAAFPSLSRKYLFATLEAAALDAAVK